MGWAVAGSEFESSIFTSPYRHEYRWLFEQQERAYYAFNVRLRCTVNVNCAFRCCSQRAGLSPGHEHPHLRRSGGELSVDHVCSGGGHSGLHVSA